MAFLRWLLPVMSAPISAEFYEVIAQSGGFVAGEGAGEGTVVLSAKVDAAHQTSAAQLATDYVQTLDADPACKGATAMQSLNDPNHFVVVERWAETDDVAKDLNALPARTAYAAEVVLLGQAPTAETYRVYYNPGQFEMPPY
jgi:quinol monooxygenase YgiN